MIKPMTKQTERPRAVTLKSVAAEVGLSPGTISLVLNRAPQSHAIPKHTQERIFAAARELNYQPNPFARALRTSRTAATALRPHANQSRALIFSGAKELNLAIHALRQAGLRVPGDASVVGMDELSS
jgi:DNA-binding LacI/PurR family transcriptional regulator